MSDRNNILSATKLGKVLSASRFVSLKTSRLPVFSYLILLFTASFVSPVYAASVLSEVTPVTTPTGDTTPSVTFSNSEAGTLSVGGSCGSASEGAVGTGSITIDLTQPDNGTPLASGSYSDCTLTVDEGLGTESNVLALTAFVIDTTASVLAEVTAVATPTGDTTPTVTFSNTKAGTLNVGGSCGSASEGAVGTGNITIDLTQPDNATPLAAGTYSDCTLTVDDGLGNTSNVLGLSAFVVDTTASVLAEVTAVATPTGDTTPAVTFSNTKAGTLSVGGSCGSASEGAVGTGNITIDLTQPDNATPLTAGTYSNCTLTVDDGLGNTSNVVTLMGFVIDTLVPTVNTNVVRTLDEGSSGNTILATQLNSTDNISGPANVVYTLVSTTSNGTLRKSGGALTGGATFTQSDINSNFITYDHDGSETTSDTFIFTVSDQVGNVNNNAAANFTFSFNVTSLNDAPTGNVSITGNAIEGQMLTASNNLADADTIVSAITYQWQRNSSNIPGATGTTYLLVQADVAKTIRVVASYTDGGGLTETVPSAATSAITDVNNPPTGSVSIAGTPTEGQTLTASNTLGDADNIVGGIAYQWQRNSSNIPGATGATYALVQADVANTIRVIAIYTDGGNLTESVPSAATSTITDINNPPTGSVSITGSATEGQTLTASNTLADADNIVGGIAYQWQRNSNNIPGAIGTTYLLTQADVSKTIRVVASYTDGGSKVESVPSPATNAITDINNPPTGNVSITGTTAEGRTLMASNTLADADTIVSAITYRWQRNNINIPGATGTTYLLTQADVSKTIRVVASYTDGGSKVESVPSPATTAITDINNPPTGNVSIAGTPTEGQTLTASNSLADADTIVSTITYQWQRNSSDISGATGATYTLVQADVGAAIRVVASYTDGGNLTETAPSAATSAIIDINNPPTGSVSITGSATEEQTLTASNTLADADTIVSSITYQWRRGVNDISGATSTTYTLVQADVGETIRVLASYTDGGGLTETIPSPATAAVINVNDQPTGNVAIVGTILEGEILTISNNLADEDGLGDFSFQWNRNGSPIVGATEETYLLVQADVGTVITATISYTDAGNMPESVTSAGTSLVANVNQVGVVAINGVLAVGQILQANVSDNDGTINLDATITYQWKRNGVDIAGATSKEYTLLAADLASSITVTVIYTDDQGTVENLTSTSMVTVSDDTPPVITVPDDITVVAEGVFTTVDIGVATALDNVDGPLIPTSNAPSQFSPGITTVMWQVEDAAGNPMVGLQIVTVKPLVDFSVDQVAAENTGINGTSFSILLNGKVSYDIDVPYTVSGTADGVDHDLVDGVATITSGRDKTEVTFTINEDSDPEGMENIIVTMGEPFPDAAIGNKSTHVIEITEQNIAPVVSLSASQASIQTRTIAVGSGAVTVSSDVTDPNTTDTPTYDWSASDSNLFDIDGNETDSTFTFNPFGLEPGIYVVRLSVSDGSSTAETELSLNIFTDAPSPEFIVDSDNDGIPDVLDIGEKSNILPSRTGLFTSRLLETEAGLKFGLGEVAFETGKGQANVTLADTINAGNPDDFGFAYPSGLFDFDIAGLGAAGQSIDIVLPQQQAIPANATYRKLKANTWQEFVIDANNVIATAPGTPGFCPPPGDPQYQAGLTAGHFCVQLTIEDGGANDADGAANNRISDPSGVAVTADIPKPPGTDNSNGIFGLGSLSLWWISLFALFGLRYCELGQNRKIS